MGRKRRTKRFLPQPLTKEEWIAEHLRTADAVVFSAEEFLKVARTLPKGSEVFWFDGITPYPSSHWMLEETNGRNQTTA